MGERTGIHRPLRLLVVLGLLWALAACGGGSDDDEGGGYDDQRTTEPGDDGGDGASGSLSVLTYNVAGLPQEISDENPSENIPLISPLLEPYDVVLTQEDFDWWLPDGLVESQGLDFREYHERLRADTTHEHATPQHPGPEAAGVDPDRTGYEIGDGIGILSRHPLSDFEVRAWEGCFGGLDTSDGGAADCAAIKGFRVATMDLGGVEVDVYSLHAEAGGTDEDQALQAEDFAQLAAFIAEHSGDRALIVGGDTNLHTDGDHDDSGGSLDGEIWAGFLAEIGLVDACDELDCDDPGRIDKIAFRSSDAVEWTVTGYDVPSDTFSDEAGESLSDHEPVVVELDWSLRP